MSTVDIEVLKAFESVGVAPALAENAAVALNKRAAEITEIKSTLRLHSWMLGLIVAGIVGLIGKAFLP